MWVVYLGARGQRPSRERRGRYQGGCLPALPEGRDAPVFVHEMIATTATPPLTSSATSRRRPRVTIDHVRPDGGPLTDTDFAVLARLARGRLSGYVDRVKASGKKPFTAFTAAAKWVAEERDAAGPPPQDHLRFAACGRVPAGTPSRWTTPGQALDAGEGRVGA